MAVTDRRPRTSRPLVAATISLLAACALAATSQHSTPPDTRVFHPIPLAALASAEPGARNTPTHVKVSGIVQSVKHEKDGDLHVWVCPAINSPLRLCVTAEIIPELPLPSPVRDSRIAVSGISRFDGPHGWNEVHPVLRVEVLP